MAKYEYEKEAARGDPMPENLSLAEQQAYQAIRFLYASYRAKRVNQEDAGKEKAKILRGLRLAREKEELAERVMERNARRNKELESALSKYATDRTLENADALVKAFLGAEVKK